MSSIRLPYRITILAIALALAAPVHAATSDDEEGWQAFGHALTLFQTILGYAARSDDPQAGQKGVEEVLSGRNAEANRALAGLLEEATSDMPAQYRDRVASIGRDLAVVARRNMASQNAAAVPAEGGAAAALQARKDLHAMGLAYHDASQFLDAVRRDDALAVELYVAGRGVNLASRDAGGRSALELARANRNPRIEALLARNLPAAR